MAKRVLNHEARHARARVKNGQDEQRLKHDREVIPDRHYRIAPKSLRKDARHAYGKRGRTAGSIEERLLADRMSKGLHIGQSREIPRRKSSLPQLAESLRNSRRAVDREVHTGLQHAGGDDGHDCNCGLGQHRTIANEPSSVSRAMSLGVVPLRSANGIR